MVLTLSLGNLMAALGDAIAAELADAVRSVGEQWITNGGGTLHLEAG